MSHQVIETRMRLSKTRKNIGISKIPAYETKLCVKFSAMTQIRGSKFFHTYMISEQRVKF